MKPKSKRPRMTALQGGSDAAMLSFQIKEALLSEKKLVRIPMKDLSTPTQIAKELKKLLS